MPVSAHRFLDRPIITADLDPSIGSNINGPSLIRVPDWIAQPLGQYYLYFAHHKGDLIRLAYADELTGPWKIYRAGALHMTESLFEAIDPEPPVEVVAGAWGTALTKDDFYAHVASPDVHVDEPNNQIWMYYHGLLKNGDQQTRVAYSNDGLAFTAFEPLLGTPYFRVFNFQQYFYAIAWGGQLLRARHWSGPFEKGPHLPPRIARPTESQTFRHCAVWRDQEKLTLFYSLIGDNPERILMTELALTANWEDWQASEPIELLRPAQDWEGAGMPASKSEIGACERFSRQLRDPCVFRDEDGADYLLYTGGGEAAIGIARLAGL